MAIDTYIGADGIGFSCVGHTEGLAEPGTFFSYAGYVRKIEVNLPHYIKVFFANTR